MQESDDEEELESFTLSPRWNVVSGLSLRGGVMSVVGVGAALRSTPLCFDLADGEIHSEPSSQPSPLSSYLSFMGRH